MWDSKRVVFEAGTELLDHARHHEVCKGRSSRLGCMNFFSNRPIFCKLLTIKMRLYDTHAEKKNNGSRKQIPGLRRQIQLVLQATFQNQSEIL